MTDFPLISVIVPVYNVEQYVRECVESVAAQDYPHLEIILVDDGSTDSSGVICDELAAAHKSVFCFHKQNGGLSDARNHGLAHSHGEWISFVDSDDYVSPAFITTLYTAVANTDSLMAAVPGGKNFRDGDACALARYVPQSVPEKILSSHDVISRILYQQMDTGAPWFLYHREILGDNPFPKGLYYEDLASIYKFVRRADKVAFINCKDLYAYRMRSTSIMRQRYRHIKAESALTVSSQLFTNISNWYPTLTKAASSRCFSVCRMVFAQIPKKTEATDQELADKDALWDVIKRYRSTVLYDSDARRRERLAATLAYLGKETFTAFCYLCRKLGRMQ